MKREQHVLSTASSKLLMFLCSVWFLSLQEFLKFGCFLMFVRVQLGLWAWQ